MYFLEGLVRRDLELEIALTLEQRSRDQDLLLAHRLAGMLPQDLFQLLSHLLARLKTDPAQLAQQWPANLLAWAESSWGFWNYKCSRIQQLLHTQTTPKLKSLQLAAPTPQTPCANAKFYAVRRGLTPWPRPSTQG